MRCSATCTLGLEKGLEQCDIRRATCEIGCRIGDKACLLSCQRQAEKCTQLTDSTFRTHVQLHLDKAALISARMIPCSAHPSATTITTTVQTPPTILSEPRAKQNVDFAKSIVQIINQAVSWIVEERETRNAGRIAITQCRHASMGVNRLWTFVLTTVTSLSQLSHLNNVVGRVERLSHRAVIDAIPPKRHALSAATPSLHQPAKTIASLTPPSVRSIVILLSPRVLHCVSQEVSVKCCAIKEGELARGNAPPGKQRASFHVPSTAGAAPIVGIGLNDVWISVIHPSNCVKGCRLDSNPNRCNQRCDITKRTCVAQCTQADEMCSRSCDGCER
ncbi:hypothetical protein BLNAU_24642 [Blattamonas nauphoetae]|uniref:WAP domain-containing protein n=1 Tax=Blattamonas nauphoetae TaxID=2049346 RepID=A0ABQ9WM86_9EUKA|nr:hypothetical protein BLNAU_24642 [Blattamonas nauphoetae]